MGFGAGSVGSSGAPPSGSILMFGGDDAPDGYRLCDGTAISRTTFASLFAEIGTNYGIGDGSTTFNLPDFRTSESFPRGAVNNAALGDTGGVSSITQTIDQMPAHLHSVPSVQAGGASGVSAVGGTQAFTRDTNSTGGGSSMENQPPFLDVNFIIKT